MRECPKCKKKMIEDKYDQCYDCMQKEKETTVDTKKEGIDRAVAAKCVAQELTGKEMATASLRAAVFEQYLQLIRGN